MSDINNKLSIDIYHWAYANFQLQHFLLHDVSIPNETIENDLDTIGYKGTSFDTLNESQRWDLIKEDGFFGPFQTGNRIVTFALKRSGLDKDMFDYAQKGINRAYETVLLEYGKNDLSEASYHHSLQTLAVFRP